MSYCTDCIHYKVCGNEGVDDSAMTFCVDKKTSGDLISRQEVIEILKTAEFSEDYTVDEIQQALDIAIKALEKTEDVKPVVYCKDCKFQDDIKGCIRLNVFVDKNTFYCEYAMRKESEDTE